MKNSVSLTKLLYIKSSKHDLINLITTCFGIIGRFKVKYRILVVTDVYIVTNFTALTINITTTALTLRLLMSYIYIYIYIYIYMEHLFLMFLDHTQRRSTVGRTPLDE